MLTKKNILWISGIGGGLFIFLLLMILNNFCGVYIRECKNIFGILGNFLFSFPVVFLLSLITYKMKEQVFNSWIKFTIWFVPLTMFLIFITPDSSGSFGLPTFGKEVVAFLLTALFTIISILIILVQFFTSRKQ